MPFIGNKPTALPLSSNDLEDNIISTAKIQDNAVTPAKYIEPVPFRNIIINGDMSIAQRGTSATGLGSGNNGYHTCDRWRFQETGSPTAEFTQSQDTDVPSGQGFSSSLKMDVTTAQGSLGAGDLLRIEQRLEGQNLQYLKKGTSSAESLTMSFWVKSNKTGTYIAELNDSDNGRQISKSYTIDSASTWEKKTLTFEGDTTGSLNNDNGLSLVARWWLAAGTDFTSGTLATSWQANDNADRAVGQVNLADSTANEWYITGVQLEVGSAASDFEFLPFDVNLQRCQRYYYQFVDGINQPIGLCVGYSGVELYAHINFPTQMRTTPSLISSNNPNDFRLRLSNLDNFDTWDTIHMATNRQIVIVSNSQVSLSTGQAGWCESRNSTARVAFNSEL